MPFFLFIPIAMLAICKNMFVYCYLNLDLATPSYVCPYFDGSECMTDCKGCKVGKSKLVKRLGIHLKVSLGVYSGVWGDI